MRSSPTLKSLICAVTFFGALSTQSDALAQYKWKDANGRTVYSDQPPPAGVKGNELNLKSASSVSATPSSATASVQKPSAADKALADKKIELDKAAAAKAKEELAQKNSAACAQTRDIIKTLQTDKRIFTSDANGERRFVDDAERKEKLGAAQKLVSENCSG